LVISFKKLLKTILAIILLIVLIGIIWSIYINKSEKYVMGEYAPITYLHQQDFYDTQTDILVDKLSAPQTEWSKLNCQEREFFLEKLIMISYAPQIREFVDNYYKELRGFDLEHIIDIKAIGPYKYEMKIEISTYVGPHNPPYGSDEVTIHFDRLCDGKVADFKHKDK